MRRLRGVVLAAALAGFVLSSGAASRPVQSAPQSLAPASGASITAGTSVVFSIRADQLSGSGYLWLHVSPAPVVRNACGTIGSETEIESFGPTADPTVFEARPTFYDYPGFWMNTPGTYYWQAYLISYQGGADGCLESEVRPFTIVAKSKPPAPPPPAPKAPLPLSKARLQGTFDVVTRIKSATGIDVEVGHRDTGEWALGPLCGSGACDTRLSFPYHGASLDRHRLVVRLDRRGNVYTGRGAATFLECFYKDVRGPVTIQLRVTRGAWIGGVWRATRVSGSYVHTTAAATSGSYRCPATKIVTTVTGSLET